MNRGHSGRRNALKERIDDLEPAESLTMLKVFCVKQVSPSMKGCFNNQRIVEADFVSIRPVNGSSDELLIDADNLHAFQNAKCRIQLEPGQIIPSSHKAHKLFNDLRTQDRLWLKTIDTLDEPTGNKRLF